MNRKQKFRFILAVMSLLVCLNMIQTTYAKYISVNDTSGEMNIARWDIVVNNEHIKNTDTLKNDITPNYVNNANVAEGVIAPGSMGYFDITIEPGSTDVAFEYEIGVEATEGSAVTDIQLSKYYINSDTNMVIVDDATSKIVGNVPIGSTAQVIRIYVLWVDDNVTEKMNNDADTAVGHTSADTTKTADIQVSLTFKQSK